MRELSLSHGERGQGAGKRHVPLSAEPPLALVLRRIVRAGQFGFWGEACCGRRRGSSQPTAAGGGMPAAMAMFRHSDAPASAGKRVALVIGVNKYPNLAAHAQLQRAVNDARAVAKAFGELGFEVTAKEDTGRTAVQRGMAAVPRQDRRTAIRWPSISRATASEIDGENFLSPADVPPIERPGRSRSSASRSPSPSAADLQSAGPGVAPHHPRRLPRTSADPGRMPLCGKRARRARARSTRLKGPSSRMPPARPDRVDRLPGNDPDRQLRLHAQPSAACGETGLELTRSGASGRAC